MIVADFVSGDTGSVLQVTCTDSAGAAINLTGATVRLKWKTAANVLVERVMTIVTATSGICKYQFAAAELFSPSMVFEVEITDSAGKITTNLAPIVSVVREQIG